MSDGTKSDDCCGKNLTRGEFLAAGASMAAGASVGGLGITEEATAEERPAQTQDCLDCDGKLEGEPKWRIPAGTLNALWGDVIPRLVAAHWKDGGVLQPGSDLDGGGAGSVTSSLVTEMNNHLSGTGSCLFQDERLSSVCDYLESPAANRIPISIVGVDGFDFVLHDQGLDLFLPLSFGDDDDNIELVELLRYYVFRRTGRPSLGFPGYMTEGAAAISLDAPTGPSQARLDISALATWIVASSATNGCDSGEVLNCLRMHLGTGNLGRARRECLDRAVEGTRARPDSVRSVETHGSSRIFGLERQEREQQPDPCTVELSVESYMCIVSGLRCWQLSGAVYRGILTELPRVIATIWFEEANDCAASSYKQRIKDGGDAGAREIFMERLETDLPDESRMRFETYAPGDGDPADDDVIITNQGIFLPKPPELRTTAMGDIDPSANLVAIYGDIMNGRAGNPVFTDSKTSI